MTVNRFVIQDRHRDDRPLDLEDERRQEALDDARNRDLTVAPDIVPVELEREAA